MASYFRKLIDFKGTQSSGRFGFLFVLIISNVAVWYTWLWVCIWTRSIVDIPVGVYTALGFVNSAAFIGKVGQTFGEKQDANTSITTATETKTSSTVEAPK